MRHLKRDFQRQFREAFISALEIPGRLENKLFDAFFLNGIDIGPSALEQPAQFGPGRFRMTVKYALADEFPAAVFLEHRPGLLVHIEDYTLGITNRYGAGEFGEPIN